jgi:hydrogenase maturation protease
MQTECIVSVTPRTTLDVKVRFLHLLAREVSDLAAPPSGAPPELEPSLRVVDSLEVGNQLFHSWQEAIEREVSVPAFSVEDLAGEPFRVPFSFDGRVESEAVHDADRELVGVIVRRQWRVEGAIGLAAERLGEGIYKVTVRVLNETPFEDADRKIREEALMRALVSAHTVLEARDGAFVSLLEPPEELRGATAACVNVGTWPVLVGEEGARDVMLSSPIILYDYPKIAPESAGDLYDGTEIDEILTLRIMTLTEDEKREMRSLDDRTRRILERTETLPEEQLLKLHGVLRGLRRPERESR